MRRFLLSCCLFLSLAGCHHRSLLDSLVKLEHFPSASTIEFHEGKYYLAGDDARDLLILDSNFKPIDSIGILGFPGKRLPKETKADIEASAWFSADSLLLFGSGSLIPGRSRAFLFRPTLRRVDTLELDTLYRRLKDYGLTSLNLEGAAKLPGQLLLSNRGNRSHPVNYLVLLPETAPWRQANTQFSVIRMGYSDSLQFQGVSGMAYSSRSDKLLLTVSTEDTRNNYDDGKIGRSYLWVVDNFSAKKNWKAINPNRVIDLEESDARFRGQKIESVCITAETAGSIRLTLSADNDDGASTLFTLLLEKD